MVCMFHAFHAGWVGIVLRLSTKMSKRGLFSNRLDDVEEVAQVQLLRGALQVTWRTGVSTVRFEHPVPEFVKYTSRLDLTCGVLRALKQTPRTDVEPFFGRSVYFPCHKLDTKLIGAGSRRAYRAPPLLILSLRGFSLSVSLWHAICLYIGSCSLSYDLLSCSLY